MVNSTALPEAPGKVPSTHMKAYNCFKLVPHDPAPSSGLHRYTHGTDRHAGKIYVYHTHGTVCAMEKCWRLSSLPESPLGLWTKDGAQPFFADNFGVPFSDAFAGEEHIEEHMIEGTGNLLGGAERPKLPGNLAKRENCPGQKQHTENNCRLHAGIQ